MLGVVKTDLGAGDDFAENLTVDDHGRIVVVGRATSPTILDTRAFPSGAGEMARAMQVKWHSSAAWEIVP